MGIWSVRHRWRRIDHKGGNDGSCWLDLRNAGKKHNAANHRTPRGCQRTRRTNFSRKFAKFYILLRELMILLSRSNTFGQSVKKPPFLNANYRRVLCILIFHRLALYGYMYQSLESNWPPQSLNFFREFACSWLLEWFCGCVWNNVLLKKAIIGVNKMQESTQSSNDNIHEWLFWNCIAIYINFIQIHSKTRRRRVSNVRL